MHLPLSDEIVIDACEFMHAIYDDLSSINEMLSLKEPSLQLEGTAFFFDAFEVVSSLEPAYQQALTRAAVFHGMLERSNIDGAKVIVDTIKMNERDYGIQGDAASNDSSDEQDLNGVMMQIQTQQIVKPKRAK